MCEEVFDMAGLEEADQKSKAVLVTRELPAGVTAAIKHLVLKPNPATRYTDLKAGILGQHVESPEEAWVKLNNMTLGDMKPSALAHGLMSKIPRCNDADCAATGFVVKRMLEDRLPTPVRNGLVAVPLTFATPTNYLATADKLMAGVRAKQVAAVAAVEQGDGEDETAAVGRAGGAGGAGRGGGGTRGGGG